MSDPSQERAIDRICTDFEQGWLAGTRPRIEDFLPAEADPTLLRELIAIEPPISTGRKNLTRSSAKCLISRVLATSV